ncbi:MAG TPA: 1,2-phenylacetyl-CoA epoxidase subunit PaaC [bacterium]|jgi:ring-1,2-phenylacetyl-CoA epoxidase subunit PaaC|nr:1,2-phenylacetyl-CoA epoxidase subunit PaaC [bacterium]
MLQLEDPAVRASLAGYLLAIADDELMIGHRHSEWTGFAPDIESDVALSSIAQEEIGHAKLFYEQAAGLAGGSADAFAYGRSPGEFRNAVFTERPNGDWGFSIVRLFLYDRADAHRLASLAAGNAKPLADLSTALRREEKYHLAYGEQWLRHLAGASPEAQERVQAALDGAWPEAVGLFEPVENEQALVQSGIMNVDSRTQADRWRADVTPVIEQLGLRVSEVRVTPGGRSGQHSEDLAVLLEEMTSVWRSDPEATW